MVCEHKYLLLSNALRISTKKLAFAGEPWCFARWVQSVLRAYRFPKFKFWSEKCTKCVEKNCNNKKKLRKYISGSYIFIWIIVKIILTWKKKSLNLTFVRQPKSLFGVTLCLFTYWELSCYQQCAGHSSYLARGSARLPPSAFASEGSVVYRTQSGVEIWAIIWLHGFQSKLCVALPQNTSIFHWSLARFSPWALNSCTPFSTCCFTLRGCVSQRSSGCGEFVVWSSYLLSSTHISALLSPVLSCCFSVFSEVPDTPTLFFFLYFKTCI